ncbi:50S ribosomal protein L6 [Patescibacteria group bacterium]|nr:50S ribosomal protein L6 [Patescibacteria group bacterium]MBU1472290.1 50S ribosomal protein L6 [Patescibacteria group bacterium]MBU2460459.1 50S ribosomal protein L6 [Patescibacteria group bacterium]MBU2543994.1 50S ribosomal protein L6 [Patescibacteria group bacterium]
MSRIGDTPITVPEGVTVDIQERRVVVKGPKGELSRTVPPGISIRLDGDTLTVIKETENKKNKKQRALHGMIRAVIANDIVGITKGWSKTLELSGVGYRASLSGNNLTLTVGFSHPIVIIPTAGITFTVTEGKIMINGADKHIVGQVAATIRAYKKPEPYKGKGIKYEGEHIRKKAGKAAKAVGAGGAA